jgi:hypothetical protein
MLNSKLTFDILDENTNYKDVKKLIKSQPSYKLITSKTEKKQIINQFLEDMKKLLIQHKKLPDSLGSGDRKKFLESELSISEFENLLKEKINKNEISWEEASRKFSTDPRWKNENINESKRIELFKDYMFNLRENKKKEYRKLLQEKVGLNEDIRWHDAQHLLQNDERYREVQLPDRERIFTDYMTYVQEKIVEELTTFCNETPLITKDIPTDGPEFKTFVNKLNYDIRFQRMYKHPDRRDKIIKNRIKFLKFQFEKQKRIEAKMNNRFKPNHRNTSEPWKKGDVIK